LNIHQYKTFLTMLKQKFLQTQNQSLKISPKQIELIDFMQLNEIELEDRIKKELEENPMLKASEPSYKYKIQTQPTEKLPFEASDKTDRDIRVELKQQFEFFGKSENENKIANFLIDSLNEKGFLTRSLDELEDDISFGLNLFVDREEIFEILTKLGKLEPFGIGASNLQEYLIKQASKVESESVLVNILEQHFNDLANKDFEKIMDSLTLSSEELKGCLNQIKSFKPYPFFGLEITATEEVQNRKPDYLIDFKDGKLICGVLSGFGRQITFNEAFERQFDGQSDKKVKAFLLQKRESAEWFMYALEQRRENMAAFISALFKLQKSYFISGELIDLKPMILKDVEGLTGQSLGTLSRLSSQKFIQTHFGIISVKELFTEGIKKNDGELISNREVKEIVSKLVSEENKKQPLTDLEIGKELTKSGLNLSRRTISKYREALDIPASKFRRAI
jgi:RNA polymerase sigma-54 factor